MTLLAANLEKWAGSKTLYIFNIIFVDNKKVHIVRAVVARSISDLAGAAMYCVICMFWSFITRISMHMLLVFAWTRICSGPYPEQLGESQKSYYMGKVMRCGRAGAFCLGDNKTTGRTLDYWKARYVGIKDYIVSRTSYITMDEFKAHKAL